MDSTALQRIQQAKLDRLEELEVQAAMHGNSAPPHILTERDALRTDLDLIGAVTDPPIGADLRRALRRYDQLDFNLNVTAGLVQRVTKIEEALTRDAAQRPIRQWILNGWLFAISIGILYLVIRGL